MTMDRNTVSRSLASSSQLVANLVADWDEQEASRVERIALLQSREGGRPGRIGRGTACRAPAEEFLPLWYPLGTSAERHCLCLKRENPA